MEEGFSINIDQDKLLAQVESIIASPLFQSLVEEESTPGEIFEIEIDQERCNPQIENIINSSLFQQLLQSEDVTKTPKNFPIYKNTPITNILDVDEFLFRKLEKTPPSNQADSADRLISLVSVGKPATPQEFETAIKNIDNDICTSYDTLTQKRVKKLLMSICTADWSNLEPDISPGSFSPLIEKVLQMYPKKSLLEGCMKAVVSNLNKSQTYAQVIRLLLEKLERFYQ